MKFLRIISLFLLFLFIFNSILYANPPRKKDIPGSRDYPLISRYKGAVIQNYKENDYGTYVLGTGSPESKNFRGHGNYFSEFSDIEGEIIRTQYIIPKSEGLFKVYKNYKNALEKAGFNILHTDSDKKSSWPFWTDEVYWGDNGINRFKGDCYKPYARKGFYYIAAAGKYQGKKVYAAIFINYGSDSGKEFVLVSQDIIESKKMEKGLVTAENIKSALASDGHIALRGIFFETGKSDIKPESEPCLKEISNFIKKDENDLFYIVGHTDSSGSFEVNMKLSSERADAVRKYLIKRLNVAHVKLKSAGVSFLAPASTNKTDEGRALNRRVEIVLPWKDWNGIRGYFFYFRHIFFKNSY